MKFINYGSSGFGSSHTPIALEDLSRFETDNIKYWKAFHPVIRKPLDFERDKNLKIDSTWHFYIFYGGVEIFRFKSYHDFGIIEMESPIDNEELKKIVLVSHDTLRNRFEEIREEFPIFAAIGEISDDTIQRTADQLREVLLAQQQ
jgi:hypothetical protein